LATEQSVHDAPHCVGSTATCASQPSLLTPLQSPHPDTQLPIAHDPALVQIATALAKEQGVHDVPQVSGLVSSPQALPHAW
jgi:hypothetical protein